MTKQPNKRLIVVGGPTASGKTSFGISLAKFLHTEIISADSRQLYRELNIGVARPTSDELNEVKHHFIASHSIHEPINAGSFANEARNLINTLFESYNDLVIVGGTGLYIKSLLEGFDPLPPADPDLRKSLQEQFETNGLESLQKMVSSERYAQMNNDDKNNPQRLIRAIEIERYDGPELKDQLPQFHHEFRVEKFCIDHPRESLYERIDERVDMMFEEGLVDEVRGLIPYQELQPLQTVGYSELFEHFEGHITLEEARFKIKQHSRNYAKRQITWFKKDPETKWVEPADANSTQIE